MTPVLEKDGITLFTGDCLQVMRLLPGGSFHAVVTDPPAGISFMGREWDHDKGGRDHWIEWMCSVARECLRLLKPGGHALVWALPRTSHWTATAWENAGFEVRDRISHCFGTGYPKSLAVGKMIDKAAGAEREVLSEREEHNICRPKGGGDPRLVASAGNRETKTVRVTVPATEEAKEWDGWGTALKPAIEDWWLFRKPIDSTVADNVLEYGTGALNIGACKIPYESESDKESVTPQGECTAKSGALAGKAQHDGERSKFERPEQKGRWPAHFVHDGSPEVISLFPYTASGMMKAGQQRNASKGAGGYHGNMPDEATAGGTYGDSGSAARFFYCSKPSRSERGEGNDHPTCKALRLMRWLVRLITPPGGILLDPFAGSGTTGLAARDEGFKAILIEQDQHYCEIIKKRMMVGCGSLFA